MSRRTRRPLLLLVPIWVCGTITGLCGGCHCQESTATTLRQVQELEARRVRPGSRLLRGLQHRDPAVRARVALALGRIGVTSGEVLDQLERRLSDRSAAVRRSAVFALRLLVLDTPTALGQRALARRVAPRLLARLAREQDRGCRQELLRSLGWVTPTSGHAPEHGRALARALTGALKRPAERRAALDALAVHGAVRLTPALGEALVGAMSSVPLADRALVAMVVAKAGGTRNKTLLRALRRAGESRDPSLARWATRAVSRSGASPDTIDWLALRFGDHRPEVQIAAAEGLAGAGADSRERLARLLLLSWRSVSANHFRLTGPQLQPVLRSLDLLAGGSCGPDTRATARQLLELTDATDSAVSYGKKEALAVDLVHCAAARLADLCSGELTFTPRCGTVGAEWMTRDMRRAVVARTVVGLGLAGKGSTWQVEQLATLAGDDDPLVQAAALAALGKVRVSPAERDSVERLLKRALEQRDPRPLAAAAGALVELRDRLGQKGMGKLEQLLLRALGEQTAPAAACQIARALGKLRGQAREALAMARRSPLQVRGIRQCAVRDLEPPKGGPLLGATGSGASPQRSPEVPAERKGREEQPLPKRLKVVTTRGVVWLRLLTDEAPETVRRLAALLEHRRYRGARIRWSEPLARLEVPAGEPAGAKAPSIPCELSPSLFERGSVGLALPAGRDSSRGGLVLCLERRPELDGRITRVAEVEGEGLAVLRRLLPGDRINGIYIQRPERPERPEHPERPGSRPKRR